MRPSFIATSVLSVWLTLGSAARAEDAPAARDSGAAIEKGRQGLELYEQGKWLDALDRFREAEAFYHSPVFLLYAARSLRRAGRLRAAKDAFTQLGAELLPVSAPASWVEAQASARLELAELEQQIVAPERDASTAPAPTDFAAPPRPSRAPAQPNVEIRRGPNRGPYWPGVGVTATGGATVLAGAVLGGLALSKSRQLPASCRDGACPESERVSVEASLGKAKDLGRAADILWISGSLLAVAGVVLWVIDPRGDAPLAAQFGPTGGELRLRF